VGEIAMEIANMNWRLLAGESYLARQPDNRVSRAGKHSVQVRLRGSFGDFTDPSKERQTVQICERNAAIQIF